MDGVMKKTKFTEEQIAFALYPSRRGVTGGITYAFVKVNKK